MLNKIKKSKDIFALQIENCGIGALFNNNKKGFGGAVIDVLRKAVEKTSLNCKANNKKSK